MKSNFSQPFNRRQFLLRSVVTGGGIIATNILAKSGGSTSTSDRYI